MKPFNYKGHAGFLQSQEDSSNPISGDTRTEVWVGTQEFCDSLYFAYRDQGLQVRIDRDGQPWRVTVTWQNVPEVIVPPTVEWVHDTELVDKSLFSLPEVQAEAETFPDGPATYKRKIERELENAAEEASPSEPDFLETFPPATYPYASQVLFELSRGVQDYQESVEVIRRVRYAGYQYPFARAKASSRLIYSTAQIGIPLDIVTGFWFPPEVTQSIVGWRLRGQTYTLEDQRRVETIEFTLAAWSSLAYQASGGGFV